MIYSDGSKSLISNGELRWKVAQDVLFLSRLHFEKLSQKYAKSIDYKPNQEYPQAFPHFRLLIKDDSYTEDIADLIVFSLQIFKIHNLWSHIPWGSASYKNIIFICLLR